MTQEEIIQAISDDKMAPFIQPEQLAQIVAFVIENYRPSLLSNLDEAAEEYSENILANNEDLQDAIEDAFKAGAEWMAEQGLEGEQCIGHYDAEYGQVMTSCHFRAKLKDGEECLIIRKKQ